MPSSSSARRRRLSVRGLMPSSERSSSQKRERPSARSRTSRSVHFAHTTSAVAQTGQVSLVTANTLPNEAWSQVGPGQGGLGGAPDASPRPPRDHPRVAETSIIRVQLEIDLAREPIEGRLIGADGVRRFVGWLGLSALLEELTGEP